MGFSEYITMTWKEIEEGLKKPTIAILPVASVEQHGPHLPVGTDYYITNEILKNSFSHVKEEVNYWLLPTMPFGTSEEHRNYPGTVTIGPEKLIAILKDIGGSLKRTGIENLILISGHGGNTHMLEVTARELRVLGLKTFCLHVYSILMKLGLEPCDVHAGDIETSIMLNIHNSLVKESKISEDLKSSTDLWEKLANNRSLANQAWVIDDVSVAGVVGDPSTASSDKGRNWVRKMEKALAETLDEIAKTLFPNI